MDRLLQMAAIYSSLAALVIFAEAQIFSGQNQPINNTSSMPGAYDEYSSRAYTFNQPTRAFVEYRYTWPSRDEFLQTTVHFRFRSARPSGLLLYHGMLEDNGENGVPQVWVRLRRGSMHVTLATVGTRQSAAGTQNIIVGRGENPIYLFLARKEKVLFSRTDWC